MPMRATMIALATLGFGLASAMTPALAQTAPWLQTPPNKKDAVPAFKGQTRATPLTTGKVNLKVQTIASGIPHPWAIAFLPDGAVIATQKSGKLWLVTPQGRKTEITGAPKVADSGQGGLMDVSLGPDFTTTRIIWLTYSEPRGLLGKSGTTLAKAQLSKNRRSLENVTVVFRQEPAWSGGGQFGSNIEWDAAGNIFLTLGERLTRESRQHAQNITDDLGKVVHITQQGKPAPGNPFIGRKDAAPEIWSYGHRNPQGAAINPDTGKLWTVEHGPRGGDEINVPAPGKNYGWPVITYGIDYPGGPIGKGITAQAGMEQPIYYWDPVIAPSDMIFYKGSLFPWKGELLVGGLSGVVVRLTVNSEKIAGEDRMLENQGRVRDIAEAADGSIWLAIDDDDGKILRVTPG
jgi:glucose/arabinose dehydrogenase